MYYIMHTNIILDTVPLYYIISLYRINYTGFVAHIRVNPKWPAGLG